MKYDIIPMVKGDDACIDEKLMAYNLSKAAALQENLFETISRKIVNEDGEIIAGCLAVMYCWNVASINLIWVDEPYRRQRLGSLLLFLVENEAMEKGCYLMHLDTFDFQSKEFYENNGYTVFGTLEDCPKGHTRYYMKKNLQ